MHAFMAGGLADLVAMQRPKRPKGSNVPNQGLESSFYGHIQPSCDVSTMRIIVFSSGVSGHYGPGDSAVLVWATIEL